MAASGGTGQEQCRMTRRHALEVAGVVKHYPGTTALKGVGFWADYGEVSVVMGENGAGKSTLMKILAGIELPSAGEMFVDDVPVHPRDVRDAERLGIAMVHQELSVLPNLSVSANVFAGHEAVRGLGWIRAREEARRSAEVLASLGHPLPPDQEAGALSLGQQQIVELARAIARQSRILILDEPTSTLSAAEVRVLFAVLQELKRGGVCIVYISHRLNEVLEIGDRFTVLRDGRVVAVAGRDAVDHRWLVEQMTGRAAAAATVARPRLATETTLAVEGLSWFDFQASRQALRDVSFTVRRGEVVGVYGLLGAGRTELLECLAGIRRRSAGTVYIEARMVGLRSVREALRSGIALVPGDRQRDGIVPELTVRENIALDALDEGRVGPLLVLGRERRLVEAWAARVNLAVASLDRPVAALSGGNQQKAILLRCLMKHPKVLLLDEPTRGIDVGAKEEIGGLIRALSGQESDHRAPPLSVVFTSSETDEVLALADRCIVLCRGQVTLDCPVGKVTEEMLVRAASELLDAGAIH
ncbi:MAG: sugar ABC transporter ATP-binding protein [Acidobacteriaceae bacterium]